MIIIKKRIEPKKFRKSNFAALITIKLLGTQYLKNFKTYTIGILLWFTSRAPTKDGKKVERNLSFSINDSSFHFAMLQLLSLTSNRTLKMVK